MVPLPRLVREHHFQSDEVVEARGATTRHARQKGRASIQGLTKWIVYNCNFQLFHFETPLERIGLAGPQISCSIPGSLQAHTVEPLSRYAHLLY